MEYTIENLKATVESTGQTVTGRLIFTQVILQHQIVQYSPDINRKMSKMAWIPRFECNEPLEIMDDKFTRHQVVPELSLDADMEMISHHRMTNSGFVTLLSVKDSEFR